MSTVNRSYMIITQEIIGVNEINVAVILHPLTHNRYSCLLFCSLPFFTFVIEISSLPPFCLKKNQRSIRVSGTNDIYKIIEFLIYNICLGIREHIKYKCISMNICQ